MTRVKQRAVAMAHREVAVVVINRLLLVLIALVANLAQAAVLPDERIDILYHGYDGGGAQIDGPSILVRKSVGSSVSIAASYYVDMVSSASIDVLTDGEQGVDMVTQATVYSEERKETGVSAQYLYDRSTISLGYANSKESDYQATTYSFGIDQSFFGDLTTLGFGVSLGEDVVGKNGDSSYQRDLQRRKYSISASQIVTKNLLMSVSLDTATDQCLNLTDDLSCLNNPYRRYRFKTDSGYSWEFEKYPHTRNSDALGIRAMYHLPWRASLRGEYRIFEDSWGIEADNYELRYAHSYIDRWIFEGKVRIYNQSKGADFYQDIFDRSAQFNYMARDKELSQYTSTVFGLGVTYKVPPGIVPWFSKSTVNLYWDHFDIDYDNFRDARVSLNEFQPGEEPLYSLQADVIRFYLSFWF
jgi:uncharacterized protein YerC